MTEEQKSIDTFEWESEPHDKFLDGSLADPSNSAALPSS